MLKSILLFLVVFSASPGLSVSSTTCDPDEFPCSNGECIERLGWCDAEKNCRDGTDELFCKKGKSPGKDPNKCRENKLFYLCLDGTCIPRVGRCDGLQDCDDKSDEKNCTFSSNVDQLKTISKLHEMQDFAESEPLEIEKEPNRPLRLYRYVDESTSYIDLPHGNYRTRLNRARDWLISQRKENFGWGEYTARAVIAMYLSKDASSKTEEDLLMDKQLDIQLAIALTRNDTQVMSLTDLALYINALLAACKNPRNFYGHDLVQILRERAHGAYLKKKFTAPFVHLTLCMTNETTYDDVRTLQEILGHRENVSNKIDLVSLAVLASSCIVKTPLYSHSQYRRNMVEQLLYLLKKSGLPGNIYQAALVMQALNEAKVDPHEWERDDAIDFILRSQAENGSFGDILATYYAMPILSGRSLLSLSDNCGKDFSNGKIPLAILRNTKRRKITVKYSLLFGDPVEMTQKVQIQVPEGTNFLDVMRLAQEENPNFRFKLDETKTEPFVYSIGGTPNDAECGRYWSLYIQNSRDATDFFSYGKDIRQLQPRDGEEIQFWWKQM